MKLTLTREQIPLARETVAWLRNPDANYYLHACESLPGFCERSWSPGWADALEAAITEAERPAKPTIKLRIRVGVTADGKWSAFGRSIGGTAGHMSPTDVVGEDIGDHGPIVAWHWVRAEVPMPETEQGDVAGEVEQSCEGMSSDQKVQP